MSLHVDAVYNPRSGSALPARELRRLCKHAGVVIDRLHTVQDNLERTLQPVIKRGGDVLVIGGDGTISYVAGLLADTKASLLPLPGGTLNNFTKDIGIDQDITTALQHAVSATPRRIDIAEVDDKFFINNSSIGLYPQSLQTRKRLEDRLGKWPAAIVAVARALVRYRTYTVTVGKETFQTPFIFVGNNQYTLEDFEFPRRAKFDEGILSVYIVKTTSRWELMRLFLSSKRSLRRSQAFEAFQTVTFTIDSPKHRHVFVSRDGEVSKLMLPLTYRLHKKALRVRY